MISENDEFKVRELQDRKKIQYLLSISGAGEDGTTYFRKRVPKSVVQGLNDKENVSNDIKSNDNVMESSNALNEMMESIEIQASKLRITALLTQIEEQNVNSEAHVKQLKNENAVKFDDLETQNDRLKSQIEGMLNENEKLRHISRENIRGLLNDNFDLF